VTGLALPIGLEGLPILGLSGAAIALRYVLDPAAAAPARAYGLSLAAGTMAACAAGAASGRSPDRRSARMGSVSAGLDAAFGSGRSLPPHVRQHPDLAPGFRPADGAGA